MAKWGSEWGDDGIGGWSNERRRTSCRHTRLSCVPGIGCMLVMKPARCSGSFRNMSFRSRIRYTSCGKEICGHPFCVLARKCMLFHRRSALEVKQESCERGAVPSKD